MLWRVLADLALIAIGATMVVVTFMATASIFAPERKQVRPREPEAVTPLPLQPVDARGGLRPSVDTSLLSTCPICGMEDGERFKLGVGTARWHGWPAHASCVEWLGEDSRDGASGVIRTPPAPKPTEWIERTCPAGHVYTGDDPAWCTKCVRAIQEENMREAQASTVKAAAGDLNYWCNSCGARWRQDLASGAHLCPRCASRDLSYGAPPPF